ncbi:MAG: S41 family peptidase [Planctomycetota bacterium]
MNVSMHPNGDHAPAWSPDGKTLAFLSTRDGDEADVWQVHLDRRLDGMTPGESATYRELLGKLDRTPPSVAAVQSAAVAAPNTQLRPLDLDDAYLRLTRVTEWRGDEGDLALVPTGVVASQATEDGQRVLYHLDPKGERTELARSASLSDVSWSGKTLLLVQHGRAAQIPSSGGKLERIGFSQQLDVDRQAETSQKFTEAARVLGETFYHPTLKGLDWPALSARYHDLATRSRTAAEFSEVANRFLGELNASHLGIYPPTERPDTYQPHGRLGVDVREEPAGAVVTRVLEQGPAARAPTPLLEGDRIVAVQGAAWTASDTLEARLRGRVGQETRLEVERPRADGEPLRLTVLVTPVSWGEARTLRYQAWTADCRDRVHALSQGRLGYLHIRGMNLPSLMEFERDLFAAAYGREGLVVDVRNNGGGWTADRVLGALMARPHAYTVPRGADPAFTRGYPQGRLYIQRYADPVNMLCNEKSFSNAEILSHAFRTYGRGTLVGEQTYGGVISTGAMTLLDGTRVRLPFRGWFLLDGTDMENHGAVPQLRVPQTPEDEVAGLDRQLEVAVQDLLERLDR